MGAGTGPHQTLLERQQQQQQHLCSLEGRASKKMEKHRYRTLPAPGLGSAGSGCRPATLQQLPLALRVDAPTLLAQLLRLTLLLQVAVAL